MLYSISTPNEAFAPSSALISSTILDAHVPVKKPLLNFAAIKPGLTYLKINATTSRHRGKCDLISVFAHNLNPTKMQSDCNCRFWAYETTVSFSWMLLLPRYSISWGYSWWKVPNHRGFWQAGLDKGGGDRKNNHQKMRQKLPIPLQYHNNTTTAKENMLARSPSAQHPSFLLMLLLPCKVDFARCFAEEGVSLDV